jgi:hypothetical protein
VKPSPAWRRNPHFSFVYFIEGAGLTKVGRTIYLASRFGDLSAASPVPLRIVMVFQGGVDLEKRLHLHFAPHRRHGEWFAMPAGWQDEARSVAADTVEVPPDEALERVYYRPKARRLSSHGEANRV